MLRTGPPLKQQHNYQQQRRCQGSIWADYVAFVLIANVFMVMGQTLTLTRCSHLVQIVSLIAHC